MRGQVTIEYSMMVLVGLALLSVSVFALSEISKDASSAERNILLKNSADAIRNAAEDVCIMGSGSSVFASVGLPLTISQESDAVVFSLNSSRTVREFSCGLASSYDIDAGRILVKNENGKISISNSY